MILLLATLLSQPSMAQTSFTETATIPCEDGKQYLYDQNGIPRLKRTPLFAKEAPTTIQRAEQSQNYNVRYEYGNSAFGFPDAYKYGIVYTDISSEPFISEMGEGGTYYDEDGKAVKVTKTNAPEAKTETSPVTPTDDKTYYEVDASEKEFYVFSNDGRKTCGPR